MVGGEEGLVAKEKFEQRPEGSGDTQQGNSMCEGPEAGVCSRLSGNDNGRACFGQAGLSTLGRILGRIHLAGYRKEAVGRL